jgi:phosphatidylinositol phospholipase C delta
MVQDLGINMPLFILELKQEFQKARNVIQRVRPSPKPPPASPKSTSLISRTTDSERPKPKMSSALLSLLVYTVGVKCRGINKKEDYAPGHIFSLSENTANKMLKGNMIDLIKHNRTHLVRIYPKGMRLNSTNYEPHRYWATGAQLVAMNWQTFGELL